MEKHAIYFPLYHIYSPLIKASLGMKDTRSIDSFFRKADIKVYDIGGKKCVTCEDLLNVTKPKPAIFRYKTKSGIDKELDEMFPD